MTNIKALIRGHLLYLNKIPIKLEKSSDELFKTNHYSIIVGDYQISFKQNERKVKIKYDDIKEFYIRDTELFIFKMINKKKLYFKII